MEKLYLIQNRFNKSIVYYSYDSQNLPVEQTFTISAEDFLSYLEFHASERFFVISERLESTGTTSDLQLAAKWDKFISLNEDRYAKLISLMLRNYNGLNNYEGHSTLTDTMGEKNSENTMGEKNSEDVKGTQTVTNAIGERSVTTSSDTSGLAAPFDVGTSTIANGANLNTGTESSNAATDSSTVSGYTDTHKENSYVDSHKEETYTDTHEEYKWGNLGVSTGADMIQKEVAIRSIGYPELIFVEFINQVSIY